MNLSALLGVSAAKVRNQGMAAALAAAIGGFAFVIALIFLTAGSYLALLRHHSPADAAFITAGGALLIAVLGAGVAAWIARKLRHIVQASVTADSLAALVPVLLSFADKHRRLALAMVVAGLGVWLLGRKSPPDETE